ncbi:HlyD family type I secretion periplasmic adaptor subunit, partial [Pseudomaricurvus sp.]|uniref:HlyD family type I secretion periplasmic adaptor subunit n=1 Tax=Pseudomaricurvus sp. TaxID=2004510 RepID=UPI003F6BB8D3
MSSSLYWQQVKDAYRARSVVWLISALLLVTLIWAAFATLDEVVVGAGKVVPAQSVQKIQSLEGGILRKVQVREGQVVEAGDMLVKLDDTRFRAAFQEAEEQSSALLAKHLRLKAELESVSIGSVVEDNTHQIKVTPQEVSFENAGLDALSNKVAMQKILITAQAGYRERINQLLSQVEEAKQKVAQQSKAISEARRTTQTLRQGLALVSEEVQLTRDVVATGAVAKVELLKLQRDEVNLKGDLEASILNEQRLLAARDQAIAESRNIALEFRTNAQVELADVDSQLAQLAENRRALADQLTRTQLLSPIRGKVKNIATRTVGGVIKPGEAMMEIVPIDDQMIVEARIAPQDIAFIREGLEANVKFTAYDFVIYGGLDGQVTYVSSDALQDEEGTTYYEAHVKTHDARLHELPIIP